MIYIEFKKKFWERSMLANMVFEDKIICQTEEQAEQTMEKLRSKKRYGVAGERYTIEDIKIVRNRSEYGND